MAEITDQEIPTNTPVPLVFQGVTYGHQCGDVRILLPVPGMFHVEFEGPQVGFHVKRAEEGGKVLLRVDNIFDKELFKKGLKEGDEVYAINGHLLKEDFISTHHRFVKAIADNPERPMDIAFIEGKARVALDQRAIKVAADQHKAILKEENKKADKSKSKTAQTPPNPHHDHALGEAMSPKEFKSLDVVRNAKGSLKKYLKNYEPYTNFPYTHHNGQYEPLEMFDQIFIDRDKGLLVKADNLRAFEKQGCEMRQKVTDILYMSGFSLEEIPRLVSNEVDIKMLKKEMDAKAALQTKEIADWKAKLKKMQADTDKTEESMFKLDLYSPERIVCTTKCQEVLEMSKAYHKGQDVMRPELEKDIADIKAKMAEIHGIEREYETDIEEMNLRQARMDKVMPSNNAMAAWLYKDQMLNQIIMRRAAAKQRQLEADMRAAGGSPDDDMYDDEPEARIDDEIIELPPDVPFNRRLEIEHVDEFWGNTTFPWDEAHQGPSANQDGRELGLGMDLEEKPSMDDSDKRPSPHARQPSDMSISAHSRQTSEVNLGAGKAEGTHAQEPAEEPVGGDLINDIWTGLTGGEREENEEHLGGHHRGTSSVQQNWAEVFERNKNGEEVKVQFAERPLLVSFGDMRALRPVYFPGAGSQAAALDNAFNHIGVDTDMVVDGNDLLFEHIAAIENQDCTKIEVVRKMLLESLCMDSKVISKDGGDFGELLEKLTTAKGSQGLSPILAAFKKQERLEEEIANRYHLPSNNTYLFEREHSEEIEDADAGFDYPRYVENYECWLGGKLPPLKKRHKRFGVYDVRRKAKKATKQKLLWMGLLLVRQDDVDAVQRILINKSKHVESTPFMSDGEGPMSFYAGKAAQDTFTGASTTNTTLSLVKIVGKAQQRRYADAFVLRDLERQGVLPYQTIKGIMFQSQTKYPYGLGLSGKMSEANLEAIMNEEFPDVEMPDGSMYYADYEELCVLVTEKYDPSSGYGQKNNVFDQARRGQILANHRDELLQIFDRYDWDRSGDLQVKEVFGILHELKFTDVTEDLVEALFHQYDTNSDGNIDAEEYLEMVVDALMTLDGSEVTWMDSAFKFLTNANSGLTLQPERKTHRRVALYFDESDGADNDLASLDLGPLGQVDVINGFEVMCRAADMTVSRQERADYFNDAFRMELVLNCFVKAFVNIEPQGATFKYHESTNASLKSMLGTVDNIAQWTGGGKTGCLTKQAFSAAVEEWKQREQHLANSCREPVGTRNLLARLDGNTKAWESASLHLHYLDMIDVEMSQGRGAMTEIFPSPKCASRFDVYMCRPNDGSAGDGKLQWLLILLNDEIDVDFVTSEFGHHTMVV